MVPLRQGLILVFLPLLHFSQFVGDFQIDSTFLNLCVQGHEWGTPKWW